MSLRKTRRAQSIPWLKNHWDILLVVLIMALGFWLRFHNFVSQFEFFVDTNRDVMVAKHIIQDKVITNVRPAAFAGLGTLQNSVLYYYILAGIWLITGSAENMVKLHIVLEVLALPLIFYALKEVLGKKISLCVVFIIATLPYFVWTSQQLIQPYWALTASYFMLSCLLIGLQKKSWQWLSAAVVAFSFELHFHLSTLAIVPAFGFSLLFVTWQMIDEKKAFFKQLRTFLPLFLFLFSMTVWAFVSASRFPFDQLLFFSAVSQEGGLTTSSLLEKINANWKFLSEFLFYADQPPQRAIIFIQFVSAFYLLYQSWRKKCFDSLTLIALFFISTLGVLFIDPIDGMRNFYFVPFYLLFFILFGVLTLQVLKGNSNRNVIWIIAGIYFSLWFSSITGSLQPATQQGILPDFQEVTRSVLKDLSSYKIAGNSVSVQDISLVEWNHSNVSFSWAVPGLYYTMEQATGENLVSVVDDYNNIQPRNSHPKLYYLVCFLEEEDATQKCLESWVLAQKTESLGKFFSLPQKNKFPVQVELSSPLNQRFSLYRIEPENVP